MRPFVSEPRHPSPKKVTYKQGVVAIKEGMVVLEFRHQSFRQRATATSPKKVTYGVNKEPKGSINKGVIAIQEGIVVFKTADFRHAALGQRASAAFAQESHLRSQ